MANLLNLTEIDIIKISNYTIAGNFIRDYIIALIVFTITMIILSIFKRKVIGKLKKIVAKTKTKYDDLVVDFIDKNIGWPIYILLSIFISMHFITIPNLLKTATSFIILIIVTYYVIKIIHILIDFGTNQIILKRKTEEKFFDTSVVDLLNRIIKNALWLIAFLFILSSIGYNITAFIAGLGIGGLAIAFALQSILVDVFASFSIYFDKPFQIGDFIAFGDNTGYVKKVGIKSTRIHALQGHEIVVSNKQLTDTIVNNHKKMEKRRILFNIGVTYDTKIEKLREIPNIIKDIIEKIQFTKIDRIHFSKFGDFSLIFEVVYYVLSDDYNKYMDIQQEINLALKERFEENGIEMAYPTQTVLNKNIRFEHEEDHEL